MLDGTVMVELKIVGFEWLGQREQSKTEENDTVALTLLSFAQKSKKAIVL